MYNKKLLSKIKMGKSVKPSPYKNDIIIDPMGQWKHPGQNTRIPSNRITMKGVNHPVLGVSNTGQKQMMQPGQEYNFPGADYVDEYPQMAKGGSSEQKIIFSPMEGGCSDGQYWTGSECKPIPPGTKIVYNQEELNKLNISKKEQQRLYNEYISRKQKHATIEAARKKKYGPIQSGEKFYKTFEDIPAHGFKPMMSYGPSSLIANGLGPGIPSMKENMLDFKTYKKLLDKSSVKPIGYKGHPGGGHFYPIYEKPSNYILGYNREEKELKEEPIEPVRPPVELEIKPPNKIDYDFSNLKLQGELPQTELPQYNEYNYQTEVPTLDIKLPKRKIARWFDRGVIDTKGHIKSGEKEITRPIPALVQKLTGYDPQYTEGYYDEEDNYIPGEIEKAEQERRRINFKGASSLKDLREQKRYNEEYDKIDADKKLRDSYSKVYSNAFKKGGAKKKYTSDIINSTNYLFAEHPLFKKKKQSKKRIYSPKASYYQDGGQTDYNIGDEVDEATMRYLKKLGFTFEKI